MNEKKNELKNLKSTLETLNYTKDELFKSII